MFPSVFPSSVCVCVCIDHLLKLFSHLHTLCDFPQCFHVPYSALTMFISSEQKERDSATAYSEYQHVKAPSS